MSGPPALPYTEAAGDSGAYPLTDPDYTDAIVNAMLLGVSFYQAIEITKAMFKTRCSRRRPIYITIALSEMFVFIYVIIRMVASLDSRKNPLAMSDGLAVTNILQNVIVALSKIFYVISAVTRCHQTEISKIIRTIVYAVGFADFAINIIYLLNVIPFCQARNGLYHDPMQLVLVLSFLPGLVASITAEMLLSLIFGMVVNATFLYTIFSGLRIPFTTACRTVATLGDAQWLGVSLLVPFCEFFIFFTTTHFIDPTPVMLQIQIMCFVRSSFSSMKSIVDMHSMARKKTNTTTPPAEGSTDESLRISMSPPSDVQDGDLDPDAAGS